ncbi:MAG: hypothetical protein ACRDPS_11985 [Nocardioides sp.]|uniref:hypothetical protein n=1 Tax=Nocardioides sp. TaxID=35761 RepID=UPI003D6AEA4F
MTTPPLQPPSVAQPLYAHLEQLTKDSPYLVIPTETGFDLKIDIVDAKWWGILNRAGLKKTYVHHVRVVDATTYSITDDNVEISWSAGVPSAHYTYERTVGRSYNISFGTAYAINDDFKLDKVYSFKFNSEESRQMIKAAAKSLGLKEKMPTSMLIGVVVGFGTLAALAIAGIGVGLYYLLT